MVCARCGEAALRSAELTRGVSCWHRAAHVSLHPAHPGLHPAVFSTGEGLFIECFVDKLGSGCSQPLRWHEPSAEEVRPPATFSACVPAARQRACVSYKHAHHLYS